MEGNPSPDEDLLVSQLPSLPPPPPEILPQSVSPLSLPGQAPHAESSANLRVPPLSTVAPRHGTTTIPIEKQSTPQMELEAAAAVEQPTDAAVHAREATQAELTAATAAHATMKEHYDEAEKTLKQKKQAKKEAGAERDRLHKLKKTAVPEARALAIYEWKDALSAEKAADEAVKMAKDARREADSARLKAWKRVQEARKAAEENSRAANMATDGGISAELSPQPSAHRGRRAKGSSRGPRMHL